MAYINPVTFDVLEHDVLRRPSSRSEWDLMMDWCDNHIGGYVTVWSFSGGGDMALPTTWHFKESEHAVLFQLTWC